MTRSSHDADAAADAAAAAATTAGPAIKTQSGASKGSLIDPGHGYPHGHLGHLTADEEKALAAFKAHLAEQGLYTPSSAEEETKKEKKTKTKTKTPPSHDDTVLLRFLRARRWVVADATKQFKDTETWRAAIQIDVLYDTIDVDAYETSRQLYPQWTGRRDRRGIPVYVFEIRHLDTKTIAAYEKSVANTYSKAHVSASSSSSSKAATTPPKLVRLFALYENLTRFAQPLCTQLTDRPFETTPITLSTNIVDVSGVSLKGFWNLKGHMQAASQLATAHYPETLDRIFVSLPGPAALLPTKPREREREKEKKRRKKIRETRGSTRPQGPAHTAWLTFECACTRAALTGHWRAHLLLDRLGLDQALVRPRHRLQDLHPRPGRGVSHPVLFYRYRKHPQAVRRQARLQLGRLAQPRPQDQGAGTVGGRVPGIPQGPTVLGTDRRRQKDGVSCEGQRGQEGAQ